MRTIKLLGCPTVAALNESYIDVPSEWSKEDRVGTRGSGTPD